MAVRNAFLCIDRHEGGTLSGRLRGDWHSGEAAFRDMNEAALVLEQACEDDKSPFPSVRRRHFLEGDDDGRTAENRTRNQRKGGVSFMSEVKQGSMRGELGSFLIRVQHRQNGSWQGNVTWMEANKTVDFRSVWELVQLVDEAVRDGAAPEVTWEDGRSGI